MPQVTSTTHMGIRIPRSSVKFSKEEVTVNIPQLNKFSLLKGTLG